MKDMFLSVILFLSNVFKYVLFIISQWFVAYLTENLVWQTTML